MTIPIVVHPAAARQPLSRDFLLPEYKDSIPGNQVQMFLRSFMEQDYFFGKEESMKREKWSTMPLAELPAEELKDYGGNLLGVALVDASRMLQVDWQLWSLLRRDGVGTLLPDVQKMRQLGNALKTRGRGQIRNRDYSGAIITLRTMFALARSFDTHPTLIANLVGLAIANMGCDLAEELIQQPGCPNLYWSFTDLPSPFLDMRLALQGERVILGAHIRSILEGPVSPQELDRLIQFINGLLPQLEGGLIRQDKDRPLVQAKVRYMLWASNPERVKLARKRLVETNIPENIVKEMSPLQVVVADDVRQVDVFMDEEFKWMKLPLWEAGPAKETHDLLEKEKENLVLAPVVVPAIRVVKKAQTRIDQHFAFLRMIEAVRLQAHQDKGKLPTALGDIKLPLPVDPVTGKPFACTFKDGLITITGGETDPETIRASRVYEVRLQK